jgi:hypothetical protein
LKEFEEEHSRSQAERIQTFTMKVAGEKILFDIPVCQLDPTRSFIFESACAIFLKECMGERIVAGWIL